MTLRYNHKIFKQVMNQTQLFKTNELELLLNFLQKNNLIFNFIDRNKLINLIKFPENRKKYNKFLFNFVNTSIFLKNF